MPNNEGLRGTLKIHGVEREFHIEGKFLDAIEERVMQAKGLGEDQEKIDTESRAEILVLIEKHLQEPVRQIVEEMLKQPEETA